MQQLSLFDFGDETPKQEKKKQPSKKGTSSTKGAETSDALDKKEIQQPDTDPVPTVPDQITSNEPSSLPDQMPPVDVPAPQKEQVTDTSEGDIEQESVEKVKAPLDPPAKEASEQTPVQQPVTPAPTSIEENQNMHSEDALSQPPNSALPNATNAQAHSKSDQKDKEAAASSTTSETESAQKVAPNASPATPQFNKDIVFSDETIIVKYKPKIVSNTNQATDSSTETSTPDNLPVDKTSSGKEQENQAENVLESTENSEQLHPNKGKEEQIDSGFSAKSERQTATRLAEKDEYQPEPEINSASEDKTSNETQNSNNQSDTNNSVSEIKEDSDSTKSRQLQAEDEATIKTFNPSIPEELKEKAESATNPEANSGTDTEGENDEQQDANRDAIIGKQEEQPYEKEQISPIPPDNIYENNNTDIESESTNKDESIDLNLAEAAEEENVPFDEDAKPNTPVISHKKGRKSFKEIDAEVDLIDVPSDEELFKKQYYPISVVAKWFRVNNSLLRFWENEFKILKPKKNKKGDRFFRPEDIKNLQIIYYLLRQKKLTINGAIKHLKSKKEHTEVNLQIIQSLSDFKAFLLELRATTEK